MNTAIMRDILKYITTHAEFVIVSTVIVIFIVMWVIVPSVSEGFGILWGSYYCPSCSYKGQSDCSTCENCGYCITNSGYGECVQGDARGPHFRKDCAIWSYNNPPIQQSPWYSPYNWIYPNTIYGRGGYGDGLLYSNNSIPIKRYRHRYNRRHRSNGRHRYGGYRFAGHRKSGQRLGNNRMMRGDNMSKAMRQRVRRNRNMTQ